MEDFFDAITSGDIESVRAWIAQEPSLCAARDARGLSAVLRAVYYQQPEIARLLAECGAPVDIFESAAAGLVEKCMQLVEQQPGLVNAVAPDGYQPLGLASFFGHLELVRWLLEKGAEVNSPSKNPARVMPLHSAVAGRHLQIARLLLEHGADVNARQIEDFSPLHAAAQNGQVEMVRLLLAFGADTQARSALGDTPLDLAVQEGFETVVELLTGHA